MARKRRSEKFKHIDPISVPRNENVNFSILDGCRQKVRVKDNSVLRDFGVRGAASILWPFLTLSLCFLQLMQQLQKSIRSDGSKRAVPPSKKIAELNASQQPNIVTNPDVHEWLNAKDDVYGDDILRLHPDSPHNVHFPFRRGDINVHSDVGGSQTAVLHDLESIWSYAVESLLRIPRNEFCHYKAVVVIPALYNRSFVKHYMSLALKQLGFSHAFVLQDHVAATFGAGLGTDFLFDFNYILNFTK